MSSKQKRSTVAGSGAAKPVRKASVRGGVGGGGGGASRPSRNGSHRGSAISSSPSRRVSKSSNTLNSKHSSKSMKPIKSAQSMGGSNKNKTAQMLASRSQSMSSKEMQRTQSLKSDGGQKRKRPTRDQGSASGSRSARVSNAKSTEKPQEREQREPRESTEARRSSSKNKVVPYSESNASGRRSSRAVKKPGVYTRLKRKVKPPRVGEVDLEGPALQAAELLNLSQKQLQHLKVVFNDIDVDGRGGIEYDEFFAYIEETRSAFSDSLFMLIDLDGSGSIDFNEFVQVLATYCMYTKDDILRFAFDIFDKDGSGTIDEKEFIEMCVVINAGNPVFPGNFLKAIAEFDRNDDGLIDYEEFAELNRRYPLIIFPAFRMQDRMQKATLGERGWNRILKQQGRKKYLEDYMASHNGALPPETFCQKLSKVILCRSSADAYAK